MRFDEPDRVGRNLAEVVRAPQRELFALDARRRHALRASVAGARHAPDQRINPIAVAFRVGEPLQCEDADTLATDRAVGVLVERPDGRGQRQRPHHVEDLQKRDLRENVDAADEHEVVASARKRFDAKLGGDKRRGARRIDGEIPAHEVEPVGDTAAADVRDEPRGDLGRQFRQRPPHLRFDRGEVGRLELRVQSPDDREDLLRDDASVHQSRHTGTEVVAFPDDDAHAAAVDLSVRVPRVGERYVDGAEHKEVIRLCAVDR